jgi:hypothetical protein
MSSSEYVDWLNTKPRAAMRTNVRDEEAYTPPNPWAKGIAEIRAALATPETKAAERFQTERLRDLSTESTTLETLRAAHAARSLPLGDLSAYQAPNPYEAALKARGAR